MNEVISLKNINKIYRLYNEPIDRLKEVLNIGNKIYSKEFKALNNISFDVKKGETLGIIGKNGAGKSTLLKIITGVLTPTEGEVNISGEISALLELGTGFNPEYTGIENIYLNGTMRGFSREEMNAKMEEIIDFADIGDFINQPVKTYSSGMFARLAFSVMISFKPDILIVDEALSVGDIFFQQKCNIYMKEKMEGVTKLLVTHDMGSIAHMADRVIVLEKGSIVYEGDPLTGIEYYTRSVHNEIFKSEKRIKESNFKKNIEINNKSIKWISVKENDLSGAQEMKIASVGIYVNDSEYKGFIKSKDKVEFHMLIEASRSSSNIIFGYIVNDKFGNAIFGENTCSYTTELIKVGEGTYHITLEIQWPEIQEGEYFITLGIGEGNDEMQHVIQCWAHNVINVKNIASIPMHALFNNKIKNVEIHDI